MVILSQSSNRKGIETMTKSVLAALSVTTFHEDLRSAVSFCSSHDAHLTALIVSMGAGAYIGSYDVIAVAWLKERQNEIVQLEKVVEEIKLILSKETISWDVLDIYAEFSWAAQDIALRALYSDVVLVGPQACRDEQFCKHVIDGALFRSPTPLLFNPSGVEIDPAPGVVMLAWDASDEAARAVQQSIEILRSAGKVHVVLVDPAPSSPGSRQEAGSDIARFLSRHGANVAVDRIASGGRPVDEVLRQQAAQVCADVIVMGAYNHPRLQQRLFGGVTRSMIEHCKLPLFLAH